MMRSVCDGKNTYAPSSLSIGSISDFVWNGFVRKLVSVRR